MGSHFMCTIVTKIWKFVVSNIGEDVSTLDIYSREMKTYIHKKTSTIMLIAVLFIITKS